MTRTSVIFKPVEYTKRELFGPVYDVEQKLFVYRAHIFVNFTQMLLHWIIKFDNTIGLLTVFKYSLLNEFGMNFKLLVRLDLLAKFVALISLTSNLFSFMLLLI